jgi:hypothetical protein
LLHGSAHIEGIDPDRLGDVLELGRTKIAHSDLEPSLDLTVSVLGKTYRTRLGDALQTRGDIDAVAHQVAVLFLDQVSEVKADPEFDAAVGRQACVTLT